MLCRYSVLSPSRTPCLPAFGQALFAKYQQRLQRSAGAPSFHTSTATAPELAQHLAEESKQHEENIAKGIAHSIFLLPPTTRITIEDLECKRNAVRFPLADQASSRIFPLLKEACPIWVTETLTSRTPNRSGEVKIYFSFVPDTTVPALLQLDAILSDKLMAPSYTAYVILLLLTSIMYSVLHCSLHWHSVLTHLNISRTTKLHILSSLSPCRRS